MLVLTVLHVDFLDLARASCRFRRMARRPERWRSASWVDLTGCGFSSMSPCVPTNRTVAELHVGYWELLSLDERDYRGELAGFLRYSWEFFSRAVEFTWPTLGLSGRGVELAINLFSNAYCRLDTSDWLRDPISTDSLSSAPVRTPFHPSFWGTSNSRFLTLLSLLFFATG